MKQLLFLLLFPCLAMAQYQGNGNQKITLGEQTTADGLVYRGRTSDTVNLLTNKLDTSVYIVLDTGTRAMWYYQASTTPKWTRLVDSLNNLQGTLSVAKGGTGSTTQNFVDLSTNQTVNGLKTFSNIATFNDSIKVQGIKIGRGNVNSEDNLSIGVRALTKNTTLGGGSSGLYNVAIGVNVLQETTTGNQNTAIGFNALSKNNTGSLNVALGVNAARFNTSGSNNFGLGTSALDQNTTGSANVAIGRDALRSNTTSNNNIGIGFGALDVSTGSSNTAIGYLAGYGTGTNANTTGSNNTFIGNESVGASATASNVITLGNSSIATIRAQVTTITSLSDIRDKTEVIPLNYGMNFIDKLKPVSFVWDMRDGGKIGIPEIGFIAQDLQQAQIDTGINIPNLVSGVDEKLEASYGVLLPIIVKALQEANEKIKSLEERIINLENK